jgi:hypothetical protein
MEPSKWTWGRVAAVLAFTGVLAFVGLSALAPLHLVIRHEAEASPRLTIDGKRIELVQRPGYGPLELVIENRSSDASSVQFLFPETALGNRLGVGLLQVEQGEWHEWPHGGRLYSGTPGSRVRFRGAAADLSISFVRGPHEGVVGFGASTLPLRREREGVLAASVKSGRVVSFTSRVFLWKPLRARLERLPPGARVELTLASRPFRSWTASGDAPLLVEVSRAEVLSALVAGHAVGLRYVLYALAVCVALWLAGAGFFTGWKRRASDLEAVALAAVCALCVLTVVSTSLSYGLPGAQVAVIVMGLLMSATLVSGRRLVTNRAGWSAPRPGVGMALLGAGLVLGLVGAFWPAFHGGEWFLGQLQTDNYYYSGLSLRLKSTSLFALDSVNGFSMRALELVTIGLFSNVLGLATREAMIVFAMVCFLLTGLLGYAVAYRVTRSEVAAGLVGALACLWAPSAGLYMEGYFTQYVHVVGLVALAAAGLAVYGRLGEAEPVLAPSLETVAVVVTMVYCLAVYPYFTLLPAALLGPLLLLRRHHLKAELWGTAKLAGLTLALSNLNLLVILNASGTSQFVAQLNALARHTVFPFYKEPRFFSFVLGMSPFHSPVERLAGLDVEFSSSRVLFKLGVHYLRFVNTGVFLGALVLLLAVALAANWRGWVRLRSRDALLATLALYFGTALLMGWRGQTYSYAKLMWTASTLLPVFLGCLLLVRPRPAEASAPERLGWRGPVFAVLLVGSGLSLALNNLTWYGNPQGLMLARSHVSLVRDLSGHEWSGLSGTDKDRVLLGQLVPAFEDLGLTCTNCGYNRTFGTVESAPLTRACPTGRRMVVVLGLPDHRCSPEDRVLYVGEYVTLLETEGRQGQAGGAVP